MSDINQVTITGRLGADPELRRTQAGSSIANLRVAVSEVWRDKNSGERKERTEWIPVVIFNEGLCKVAEQYLRKGSRVLIQGKWTSRKWQDQSGNDRYATELTLQGFGGTLTMLDGPSRSDDGGNRGGGDYGAASGRGSRKAEPARDSYGNMGNAMDDDIPFAPEWRG